MIELKKKKTNVEKKETHVDNHGFGFWVEISTYYFFLLYTVDKASQFFWEKKSKMQTMSSSLRNDKFLFGMLYINLLNLVWF